MAIAFSSSPESFRDCLFRGIRLAEFWHSACYFKLNIMKGNAVPGRTIGIFSVMLMISGVFDSALGIDATVTHTNWNERWITNVIEVRMPINRFVTEYHTNWIEQFRNRVINVYATNWTTRTLTNKLL